MSTLIPILFLCIVAAGLFVLNIWLAWWASHSLLPFVMGGGPYVPIPEHYIEQVMQLANVQATDVFVDIGSGDGRLLIAAAEAGAGEVIGYEIHPGLVIRSRRLARANHLEHKITIHKKSFWNADFSRATIVTIYQMSYTMKHLEKKLLDELPASARVVTHGFHFPNWKSEDEIGNTKLYVKK